MSGKAGSESPFVDPLYSDLKIEVPCLEEASILQANSLLWCHTIIGAIAEYPGPAISCDRVL